MAAVSNIQFLVVLFCVSEEKAGKKSIQIKIGNAIYKTLVQKEANWKEKSTYRKKNANILKNKNLRTMPIGKDVRNESDDEPQSEDEVLSAPVNRKRGRPTKDGKPKAAVPKQPVVARGRGRPRKGDSKGRGRPKKVAKTDEAENNENSCSSEAEEDVEDAKTLKSNAEEQTPVKGRGRAKKT